MVLNLIIISCLSLFVSRFTLCFLIRSKYIAVFPPFGPSSSLSSYQSDFSINQYLLFKKSAELDLQTSLSSRGFSLIILYHLQIFFYISEGF